MKPKITIYTGMDGLAIAKKAELAAKVKKLAAEEKEENAKEEDK